VSLGGMSWRQTLNVHWLVPADPLLERLPRGVTLECWRGHAVVSLSAFDVEGPAPRRLLHTPMAPLFHYQQLDLRTYVQGPEGPGMTLLHTRLDRLTWALGARLVGMPYHLDRKLAYSVDDEAVRLRARDLVLDGKVVARPAQTMPIGSLEWFADERYRFYASLPGARTLCMKIAHAPWRARSVELHELRMKDDGQLRLDLPPASVQVCEDVEVVVENAATFATAVEPAASGDLAPA
jgi:uncharacterized protein YqjF (DUF2071 family)